MVLRERLCGECLWIVNMATCGVDGVLVSLMGRMGLVYGNLLDKVGVEFSRHTGLEVGDGSKVTFWHDV